MESGSNAAVEDSGPEPSGQPGDSAATAALLHAAAQGDAERVHSMLHAGADACYQDEQGRNALMLAAEGGHTNVAARLLETGAPWNAIDKEGHCAGDLAMQGGHQATVDLLLDAGVRAELVLGALERKLLGGQATSSGAAHEYLQQRVRYERNDERLMEAQERAVMMAWEGPLMEAHAHAVCAGQGDVLNVGFGLGLVDEAIQRRRPASHTIVEAHPDVHARMLELGWDKRPGVTILFGRWQDMLPAQNRAFDGIFFDTFSEDYGDMQDFHALLPCLLRSGGIYSYFNGLTADNAFFHQVYLRRVRGELASLGLKTEFVALPINVADPQIWEGVRNRYWQLDIYYLPVCSRPDES